VGRVAATTERSADVIVVGAGPAGSAAAWQLRQAGREVVVLEKAEFPREKVCGDGLTPRGVQALRDIGVDTSPQAGWVRHKGLRVHGGGVVTAVDWPRLQHWPDFSLVLRRSELDARLAAHAAAVHPEPLVPHPAGLRGGVDADVLQRLDAAGGEPVTADLLAREVRLLQDDDLAPRLPELPRRRGPGRSGADDEDVGAPVGHPWHASHLPRPDFVNQFTKWLGCPL
jgi:glycine/D-amino acid oxidase-like deaminating enzyme